MSRTIPEETIQEILLRTNLVEVISDYVLLKKSGTNYKGLCPFHTEKTPSFSVSLAKGLFHCFGCQASGNAVHFLMRHEGLAFPEAVGMLAARVGVQLPEPGRSPQQDTLAPLYDLHQAVATFFHDALLHDPGAQAARDYCRQRQMTSEMIEHFSLGYAPDAWDALNKAMLRQGFTSELLVQSGLVIAREGQRGVYDRFRHRLMFPIANRFGRPIAFGGRQLERTEAIQGPKYLNSPETPIFHKSRTLYGFHLAKQAIRQHECAIITEGYTDVLACHRQGVTHVVGTLGTALTEHHVTLLKGCTKEVVLVFDGDAAGGAATERSIGLFLDAGMRIRIVELPAGEDPDSFLQHHTSTEFLQHVEAATTFLDYLLARAQRSAPFRTPASQADCVERIVPLLRKIDNPIEQWGYLKMLAEKIGVPPEVLQRQVSPRTSTSARASHMSRPAVPPAARLQNPAPDRSRPLSSRSRNEEYVLLQVLCHAPHLLEGISRQLTVEDFADAALRDIYALLLRLRLQSGVFSLTQLPQEVSQSAQAEILTKMALEPAPSKPEELQQAVEDCLLKIRQRRAKAERQQIIQLLHSVGDSAVGDNAAQQRVLLQEFSQLRKENPVS